MPTYEFRCPEGHEFERFYKTISTAPSEVPCPECGAVGARQLSAGAGFSFKGSGFYLTDYGKNAHRGEAPDRKGGETTETKADMKSDKTADTKADKTADKTADTKADKTADTKADTRSDTKADKKPDTKAESVKPKSEAPKSSKKESE